jgi:hypothetical protein
MSVAPDAGAPRDGDREHRVDEPGPERPADGAAESPDTADGVQRCDLCGAPMQEWHCRIICTFCGYQRDCSDP